MQDLTLQLLAFYGPVALIAAFALVAVLAVLGVVAIPAKARAAFFTAFGVVIVGFGLAYATCVVRTPSDAVDQAVAAVESGKAFSARNRSIVPTDAADLGVAGTVYIQAPDMDARFAAETLWKALTDAGLHSPGIELTPDRAPSTPEVRYFNDSDRPLADKVAAIAAAQGLTGAVVKTIAGYKAPPGQIEFWYPR